MSPFTSPVGTTYWRSLHRVERRARLCRDLGRRRAEPALLARGEQLLAEACRTTNRIARFLP